MLKAKTNVATSDKLQYSFYLYEEKIK